MRAWTRLCWIHIGALSAYLVLSIALTWPLVTRLRSATVAESMAYYADASQNVWNMWWTHHAVTRGLNLFWSSWLYFPEGVQMYVQTLSPVTTLPFLPVQAIWGPIAAYNLAVLTAVALTGYCTFLLVRAFVPGAVIPWICGALLTAAPFHMLRVEVAQINLLSIQWIPLYLLMLVRLERRGWWRDHLAALAALLLVVLTDWYWLVVCLCFTAAWLPLSWWFAPERQARLRRYALFSAGLLALLSLLAIGVLRVRHQLPTTASRDAIWRAYIEGFSADGLGLLFPAIGQPWWGAAARRLVMATARGPFALEGYYIAAGWVLLALAGLGMVWFRHAYRAWWLAGLSGWMVALGPRLYLAGWATPVVLPYAWLERLPLMSTARRPSQFAVPLIVVGAVAAGLALHHLRQRLSRRRWYGLLVLVVGLAGLELWPPARTQLTFDTPAWLAQLRSAPGAVADLPLEWMESSRALRRQLVHEQPILGGYVARRPPYRALETNPWLGMLAAMAYRPDIIPLDRDDLQAMQCAAPVRHVLLTRAETTPEQQAALERLLTMLTGAPPTPRYQDAELLWYELPVDAQACRPFVALGTGWHDLEQANGRVWRWSTQRSTFSLTNPFAVPVLVQLHVVAHGIGSQTATLWQGSQQVAHLTLDAMLRDYRLLVMLVPGANVFELRTHTVDDLDTTRQLGIAVLQIAVEMTKIAGAK
ncbi:hypothetical protein [Kallotenue papyrolyticum]|uniref:hypothetical protein n=1 Tax=Kallotenue papyrolyticum TaxID=1325125 RepID=UPI0004922D53|nr:hypothetical protein [Kallotenue papyrolyticum]